MRTIYLDMDGVVADFNKFASNVLGREIGWGVQDLSSEEWEKLGAINSLYFQLPLIEDSTKLVGIAKSFSSRFNVEFLTAVPRVTTMPSAALDKKIANTRATTTKAFKPNSYKALLKASSDLDAVKVRDAPTVKICRTAAITPIIKNLSN